MKTFFKSNYLDAILCLVASIAFSINFFAGFFVYEPFANNLFITSFIASIFILILFVSSYNKKSIVISIIGFVALLVAGIILARTVDISGKIITFFVILFFSTFLIFILSRNPKLMIVLFGISIILLAGTSFLDYKTSTIALLVYIFTIVALFIFKNYKRNATHIHTEKTAFFSSFIVSLSISAISLTLSALIFFLVIAPINPATKDLKILTELRSLEIFKKIGVATTLHLENKDLLSDKTNDDKKTSNEPEDKQKEEKPDKDKEDEKSKEKNEKKKNENILNNSTMNQVFQGVAYIKQSKFLFFIIFSIPIFLTSIVLLKLYSRKQYLNKISTKDSKEQIYLLFNFFNRKLKMAGFNKPPNLTPLEYASVLGPKIDPFKTPCCTYKDLTEIFTKVYYGEIKPSKDELDKYYSFYKYFFENAKYHLGKRKYYLRFFKF